MNRHIAYAIAILVAQVLTTVHAQETVYKSPQEVFDAAKAAAKMSDYKAFHSTLTPESADIMAGQLALYGMTMRAIIEFDKTGKTAAQMKPLFDAMSKHGLTEEVLKKMVPRNPNADQKEKLNAVREAIKPIIKKQAEFVHDMMVEMKKISPKSGGLEEIADDTLEDVKINEKSDAATANAVRMRAGKKTTQALQFEKINGSWRIVLPRL